MRTHLSGVHDREVIATIWRQCYKRATNGGLLMLLAPGAALGAAVGAVGWVVVTILGLHGRNGLAILAACIAGSSAISHLWHRRRAARYLPEVLAAMGRCTECGYLIAGLPRCPECGHVHEHTPGRS
jgi:hypothetical protein